MLKTDKLSMTMKRFREIYDVSSSHKIPIVEIEDQLISKGFESSERSRSNEGNIFNPRHKSRSRSKQSRGRDSIRGRGPSQGRDPSLGTVSSRTRIPSQSKGPARGRGSNLGRGSSLGRRWS